ncbi:Cyclic nucleotide-gated channel cone photoreceptor subunit alpha [Fasciola gigantica]|uniref:Cyclic nucleotide-gated channel cone photoreceptor subunit alpha n=1 Tax=Fasciola gigantica TaxID=46835 RepID=A0A504Z0W2_FASGI|nr:Cyclic nucleotide-gated channel cone photoreceptor subunit alpha [Fasciola gigantica]
MTECNEGQDDLPQALRIKTTRSKKVSSVLCPCWKKRELKDADLTEADLLFGKTAEGTDKMKTENVTNEDAQKGPPLLPWKRGYQWITTLVVDSSQSAYYYWIGIVSATVLYNSIVLPMRSAFTQFHELSAIMWMFFDYLIDAIYFIDIFVGCRTGFLEQGLLVRDVNQLRKAYLKRREIYADVLAVFPTDLLYLIPSVGHYGAWLRFNRLLKVYRLFEFIDRTETRTTRPYLFRISTLTMNILVLIHLNACIYFGFSKATGLGSNSFVYPPRSNDEISEVQYNYSARWNHLFSQYVYSFYWSTLILTTIGETPKPVYNAEYIFITIDFLAGVLIFATVVGNVGAMITNMNAARTEFQSRMDGVKRYMEFRKVNKELELRVIRWFDYLWTNKQSLEEDTLNALPDKLKAEIAIHVHFDTLKRVSIFKDCDPGLLVELVLKLQLQVFSPGDYICRKGDIGKEMYIVKRGKLSVVSEDGKTVFVTLGEGSVFGEISILDIAGNKTGNRRSANVRSVGYSDLFCLSKDDLWDALTEYPEAKEILMQRGEEILRKDNLIDEEVLRKAQEKKETIEQCVTRVDNTLNQISTRLARLIGEFGASQAKLKRRLTRLEEYQYFLENQIPDSAFIGSTEHGEIRNTNLLFPGPQLPGQVVTTSAGPSALTARAASLTGSQCPPVPTFARVKRNSVISISTNSDRRESMSSLGSTMTCATIPSNTSNPREQ